MDTRHPRMTGKPWPTGGFAHPDVIEKMRRPDYPWNTGQVPPLPPIPSQAPRPEGLQRVLTGVVDAFTNNYFDFDQRGRGGSNRWEEQIGRGTGGGDPREAMRQWNAPNDINFAQNQLPGPPVPTQNPQQQESRNFLGRFLGKLGEIWNKPIMAPNITKQEHDRMIRGENTGPNNWDSRY